MYSKRIHIPALLLLSCLALVGFSMGLQQMFISLNSFGTIYLQGGYVCGNYNSTHYYAQNKVTGEYEWISTDATQTISYALSKLTHGRTWQETVLLKGNFSVYTTITLSDGNVLLDCSQATLTTTARTTTLDVRSSHVTILGGHWIGPADGVIQTAIRFITASARNCTVDGGEFEQFSAPSPGTGAIFAAYGSSHITIQNCTIHDNGGRNNGIDLQGYGYNKVIDCQIYNNGAGMFVSDGSEKNRILGCTFYDQVISHSIYLDGGSSNLGDNEVSGCKFYNQHRQAGLLIKCPRNKIYNNVFYNFPADAVGFSIFSEYSQATANDNEIYGNTFTDMVEAIWVGHDPANNPTLRNEIYNNTFTRVTNCIRLNPWSGAINTVEDTWIYYNTFALCTNIFPPSGSSTSYIIDTVVAYNDFSGNVTNLSIISYVNTMVYGNIGMTDFNVPDPLPIPPP